MDQVIALIVIFVIISIGKILESIQNRAQQEIKKKPDQVKYNKTSDEKDFHKPELERRYSSQQDYTYRAPSDEVEEFLRRIGILKDQNLPRIKKIPREQPETPAERVPQKARMEIKKKETAVNEKVLDYSKSKDHISLSSHTLKVEKEKPVDIESAEKKSPALNVFEIIRDKESLRSAFVVNELLSPPMFKRKFKR